MKHTGIGKKALSFILAFCMALGLLPVLRLSARAAWDGSEADYNWYGDGSADTFYIGTAAELKGLANITNGQDGRESADFSEKTVILTADIDLESREWTPIGIGTGCFCGIFDGNFHTISNLSITAVQNMAGLFGYTNNVIANLKVTGRITVSDSSACPDGEDGECAGGIAAACNGTIINCRGDFAISVAGTNSNGTYVGGLTGGSCYTFNSRADGTITIADSAATDKLSIGGLAGIGNHSSLINDCSTLVLPDTAGSAVIGEIMGTATNGTQIKNILYNGSGAHDVFGVRNDSVVEINCTRLSDSVLKGGSCDSALYYSTDASDDQSIAADETCAVIKALNNGRTAITDLSDGYLPKDWTNDGKGYPTPNFASAEDHTAPLLYGVSSSVVQGGIVNATCNQEGTLYLVPKTVSAYTQKTDLDSAAAAGGMMIFCPAGFPRSFDTGELNAGTYQIYAADKLGQISAPSPDIRIYAPAAGSDVWDGASASYDWYGTGNQSTFYLSTAADLKGFANIVNGDDGKRPTEFNGKTVILARDIDLGNYEWKPIGASYIAFSGIFDGQAHTISNLHISNSYTNVGLFAFLDATAIKNLNVSGNITTTLTNRFPSYGQEAACAGGIVGYSNTGAIVNCSSDVAINVTVTDAQNNGCAFLIGDLAGYLPAPDEGVGCGVVNCYGRGSVTVTTNNNAGYVYAGGLIGGLIKGRSDSTGVSTCENCYVTGAVTFSESSAGLSSNRWLGAVIGGKTDEGIADNCFWSTDQTSCSGIGSGFQAGGANKSLTNTGNCSGLTDGVLKGTDSGTISYAAKSGPASASNILEALNGGRSAIPCLSNVVKAKNWKFESGVNNGYPVFDETVSTLTSFSPAAGSADVSVNPRLILNFNEPVTGVSGKYLFVIDAGDGSVAGWIDLGGSQVSTTDSTVTITLPFSLKNGTKYYVAMDDGSFESSSGASCSGISGSTSWTFTTIADAAPPIVSNLAPSNGAAGVSIATNPAITLSENVTAVPGKNIYLKKTSDGSTVQTIAASDTAYVSISNHTVTIKLADGLSNGTGYYLTIDHGAFQDAEGKAFAGFSDSSAWHFTTAAANAYSVSGTVKYSGAAVSGATVKAVQGNTQFGSTATTDAAGKFTVVGVPDGEYDLVVTKEGHIITQIISVSGVDLTLTGAITLPTGYKNSTLVVGSDTPNVVVGYLDEQFDSSDDTYANTSGNTVKIELDVTAKDAASAAGVSEISSLTSGKMVDLYLDMKLTKNMTGLMTSGKTLTETGSLMKIIVPYSLSGKTNVTVYRYHVDDAGTASAEAMKQQNYSAMRPSSECYMLDTADNQIIIWAQKFSTYAIGYNSSSGSPSAGGSGVSYDTITASAGGGGSISPSGSESIVYGSGKTYAITPDDGYSISDVLVDGKSVGAVSSYTFKNITQAHAIHAVFAKISGLPYYLNDSGNQVFIGFASDKSGTMKYIAPEGKTVLFVQNQKSFTDLSGHWAKAYIDFVAQREIFVGTGGSLFSPDAGMTRAMFAAVIGRLYERSYGTLTASEAHTFTDCNYSGWYGTYVDWCTETGIIKGVGGGLFKPDRKITREEMAAILYRFASFLKISKTADETALSYPDASRIGIWARKAVLYCQQASIIMGRNNGNFAPKETATRAEVAAVLKRFIETVV